MQFITQQSTSCWREDKWRYGDGGQQWWRMTMVVDNNDMRDWVADCDEEGQEQAVTDGRDSRVVMMAAAGKMAAADNDGKDGQRQWQTTMACKIGWRTTKGMDKSRRQEMVETQSGDDGCGGGSWRRWMLTAVDNNNGNGRQ